MIYGISTDRANDAYGKAVKEIREYKTSIAMMQTIKALLKDKYITCKVESLVQQAFPGWRVSYYSDFSGTKYIYFSRQAEERTPQERHSVRLCKKGEKALDTATLDQSIKWDTDRLKSLETALAAFWDVLPQYNVICAEYNKLRDKLTPIIGYDNRY